ncbi:MAG TPA: VacJ family lipoprotein [Marinagarivorans sp.]
MLKNNKKTLGNRYTNRRWQHGKRLANLAAVLMYVLLVGCASLPAQTKPSAKEVEASSSDQLESNRQNTEEHAAIAAAIEADDTLGPYEKIDQKRAAGLEPEPTVVAFEDYSDPLQSINRPIFTFNHYTYRYLLTPISKGYQKVVPSPVDRSIGNFFLNLREPLFFLNNLFQLKPKDSGKSLLRFGINSTVGLLGLFDPAAAWGIERSRTTFGDTLAYYGAGYGAYIVLPLLGPSDLRDTTSIAFEYFAHPLNHIEDEDAGTALLIADGFHKRTGTLARYPDVIRESDDPYLFIRNLYLQSIQRDAEALQPQPEYRDSLQQGKTEQQNRPNAENTQ